MSGKKTQNQNNTFLLSGFNHCISHCNACLFGKKKTQQTKNLLNDIFPYLYYSINSMFGILHRDELLRSLG